MIMMLATKSVVGLAVGNQQIMVKMLSLLLLKLTGLEQPLLGNLMQIPLFPLSSVVMPGGLLPLRLFEPRYLNMVRDCFRGDTGFGVCLVKEGAEAGGAAVPFPNGTLIKIVDWDQGDNGLLQIVVEGEQKFRIIDTHVDDAELLRGTVALLPAEQSVPVPAEFHHLVETMDQILEQVSSAVKYANPETNDALWLGSRFVELLPLAASLRHQLLSMDQPLERLTAIAEVFSAIEKG